MNGKTHGREAVRLNRENTTQPLISVIVPVHNGRDYLRECIESIEQQTYDNIEVIIINDGSTDGTDELADELARKYQNIRIFSLNDRGVSAARNTGLDKAQGTWISFVDADDRLLPQMLETLLHTLQETDSDVAGCSFAAFSSEEQWQQLRAKKQDCTENKAKQCFDPGQYLSEAILRGNSRCWSKLYKGDILADCRFRENITIGEDMLFLVDLLPKIRKVTEIAYSGYGYFQNPRGAMYRKFKPEYMDQIRCWELAREQIAGIDAQLEPQVSALLLMGIMLTAGKLAMLSGKERRENKQYTVICREKLSRELQRSQVSDRLSRGYRIKTGVFLKAPSLYLGLYHFLQSIKGKCR